MFGFSKIKTFFVENFERNNGFEIDFRFPLYEHITCFSNSPNEAPVKVLLVRYPTKRPASSRLSDLNKRCEDYVHLAWAAVVECSIRLVLIFTCVWNQPMLHEGLEYLAWIPGVGVLRTPQFHLPSVEHIVTGVW